MPDQSATTRFEPDPAIYDRMINWDKRLQNETPFYRRLFDEVGATSVLDVACGTGHHVAMFHDWGLTAIGADLGESMIAHCRHAWGEGERLRWIVRSFDQAHDPPASVDVAICVGNSLAIVDDLAGVRNALAAMVASIRVGGALVVQVLNLWRLTEGPMTWQKCMRIKDDREDLVILKGVRRAGSRGHVDVVTLKLEADGVTPHARTATFLGLEPDQILNAAKEAGATDARLLGDYEQSPFERNESQDLILVARKE